MPSTDFSSSLLATGVLALVLAFSGNASAMSGCLDTAVQIPSPPRALAMADAALLEHQAFGGQTMDAEGRLTEVGDYEAEDTRRTAKGMPPWQRVLGYWRAIDPQDSRLPSLVRFGGAHPADRRLLTQALNQSAAASTQSPGGGPDQGLDDVGLRAVEVAVNRVAVIDSPWSAAFISWLARRAGLSDEEFVFSEAHVDYAGAAWQAGVAESLGQPTRSAMRACDLMRTPPRVGDLVCQARGDGAGLDTYDKIGEVLATRSTGGDALPMHCDVVVAVDATGFDTVGGNVVQSVTLRRLDFARGTNLLDPSYLPEGCAVSGAAGCVDRHMSRQPWSLLLQWR
ncbi:DUF2272 domain-containing protein [Variovorax sp. PAMC26660]|uniref:DUF2272 domain-containing protein n=1 Tax=Variovorax sp. PAMC26660 TaxID=2762322 RepID=UPI00164D8892|nr:DUF2272 domain-containing protein [Variovorax sp. PAMC26660]QNK69544.1 DUF2272 domain-containing protein [Variovorax sp. PAMC26660]